MAKKRNYSRDNAKCVSKDQVIVVILTLLLLCFYAVVPAFGAENGKLRVLDKDGNEVRQAEFSDSDNGAHVPSDTENDESSDSAATTDEIDAMSIGEKMVGNGIIYALELIGDAGFKVGNKDQDTVSVKGNYGNTVALIYTLATLEFDPSQNKFVQEMQLRLGLVGFFLILMFIILGAVNVNVYAMTAGKNADRAWILSNRYHIPINEYALTIAEACIMMSAGYVFLRITILAELMFTKLIMFQILDRISPTGDNAIMYVIMSLCYLVIASVIAYRIIIIGLFHASYVAFIGLYCFGITRPIAVSALWYYLKMLFLRTIIVGVTVACVGMISYIKLPTDTGTGVAVNSLLIGVLHPILYMSTVVLLVFVCLSALFGVKKVLETSKYAVKRYAVKGSF